MTERSSWDALRLCVGVPCDSMESYSQVRFNDMNPKRCSEFRLNRRCRSASVANIMLAHLSWTDDHLTVVNPRTKTDRTAEHAFPKSIYANPMQPHLCPMLALNVVTFTRSLVGSGKLFEGPEQEERYYKILSAVIATVPDGLVGSLGAQRDEIGSQSCRKGASTCFISPWRTNVSVCLPSCGLELGKCQGSIHSRRRGSGPTVWKVNL